MGNSNSQNIHNLDKPLFNQKDFDNLGQKTDERYGKVNILKNKLSFQEFAEINRTQSDQNQWISQLQDSYIRQQLDHPNIVKLVNYNSTKNTDFCSSFFKIGILYEYYTNDLKAEISDRKKFNLAYKESEILYILDSLINALHYLKSKNVPSHGDIRPYNVLINNTGQIKLGEQFCSTRKLPNYAQIQIGVSQDYYLSPQLLQNIKQSSLNASSDASKGDVFSIGMTLLEASTFQSVSNTCYNKETSVVNWNEVSRLIGVVRSQYSSNLANIIQKLLLEKEDQRPSIDSLLLEVNDSYVKNSKSSNLSTVDVQTSSKTISQNVEIGLISDDEMDRRIEAALKMSREAVARYQNSPIYNSQVETTYVTQTVQVSSIPQDEDVVKRSAKVQQQTYVPPAEVTYYTPVAVQQNANVYSNINDYQPLNFNQQQWNDSSNVQQVSFIPQNNISVTNQQFVVQNDINQYVPLNNVNQVIQYEPLYVNQNVASNVNEYVPLNQQQQINQFSQGFTFGNEPAGNDDIVKRCAKGKNSELNEYVPLTQTWQVNPEDNCYGGVGQYVQSNYNYIGN